jgi:hypothetical protein
MLMARGERSDQPQASKQAERVVAMTKMKGMAGDSYLQKLPKDWFTYSHVIAACQVQVFVSSIFGDNVSHSTILHMAEELVQWQRTSTSYSAPTLIAISRWHREHNIIIGLNFDHGWPSPTLKYLNTMLAFRPRRSSSNANMDASHTLANEHPLRPLPMKRQSMSYNTGETVHGWS